MSANETQLLGLNLIYLLSRNRATEYECELQYILREVEDVNEFIRFPMAIKDCLDDKNRQRLLFAMVRF